MYNTAMNTSSFRKGHLFTVSRIRAGVLISTSGGIRVKVKVKVNTNTPTDCKLHGRNTKACINKNNHCCFFTVFSTKTCLQATKNFFQTTGLTLSTFCCSKCPRDGLKITNGSDIDLVKCR